jgi:hypothetical protein
MLRLLFDRIFHPSDNPHLLNLISLHSPLRLRQIIPQWHLLTIDPFLHGIIPAPCNRLCASFLPLLKQQSLLHAGRKRRNPTLLLQHPQDPFRQLLTENTTVHDIHGLFGWVHVAIDIFWVHFKAQVHVVGDVRVVDRVVKVAVSLVDAGV